jgi:hypothetical protein
MQLVEVEFPPGAASPMTPAGEITSCTSSCGLLSGRIQVTFGGERYRLDTGDCLAMLLDGPIVYANRTRHPARYVVVISAELAVSTRAI